VALRAEGAHRAVPARAREAAILHEGRRLGAGGHELLQVAQRDVADAEQRVRPASRSFVIAAHTSTSYGDQPWAEAGPCST
jgi:hypothetical protein